MGRNLILAWLLACSCAEGGGSSPVAVCRAYCVKAGNCACELDGACGFSTGECEARCVPDLRINLDAAELMAACVHSAKCEHFQSEPANVFDECLTEAVGSFEPTIACWEYCQAQSSTSFECGGVFAVEDCVASAVCTWSDSYLKSALDCMALECDERVPCLEANFSG